MPFSSDSRVSSEHEEDQHPARLSALYQYHNAPEVAPAHGLEYDDTIYPVSDKFPVIRESRFGTHRYTGKHAYANDNHPPRIIFGMKIKTFLVVAAIMVLIVVGAAVGGAVGGKNLHTPPLMSSEPSGNTTTSPPTTTATTYSAPTPTYTPLTGCPSDLDNTTYTSHFSTSSTTSALSFTMHCNLASPLQPSYSAQRQAAAFVYSFADCVEVCASLNFASNSSNCTVAVYKPAAPRPANCWVGSSKALDTGALEAVEGTEVAIVVQST